MKKETKDKVIQEVTEIQDKLKQLLALLNENEESASEEADEEDDIVKNEAIPVIEIDLNKSSEEDL
ncbi:hypothetical protein [Pontibacter sp. SGAir0037]|uniref:hypothetical protein n=1 Tax=Pontibacter sp. SGAir0037 TaxID=2571030 RepID=UPI0010CD59E8|nr:hypothetical protein [Pontibacter sp. SGAir0037]QCR21976.1 hypothetical protein C1N53_06255 [Pontibacter sp. SGAir0037]